MRFEGEYSRSVAVTHQDEDNSQHFNSSDIHRSGSNKSNSHTSSSPTVDIDLSKDDDDDDEDVKKENVATDDDDVEIIDPSRTSPGHLGAGARAGASAGSIKGSPFSPSWEPSISYTPADCGRRGKTSSSSSSSAYDHQQQSQSRSAHLPLLRQTGQHFDDDDDDDDDLFDRRSNVNAKAVQGKPPLVSDLLSSTVEPDFDNWSLEDLRTEAAKYGLKTTDKATLLKSLRMLWTKTRAKENANSAAAAAAAGGGGPNPISKTLSSSSSNATNGAGGGKTTSVTTKRKAKVTSSQGLVDERLETAAGASRTAAGVGAVHANRSVDSEAYTVQAFLHSQTDFHMQMITFEPLDLDQVHARFLSTDGNTNITKHRMLEILDSLAIFVQIGLQQRGKRKNKKKTPKKGKSNGDNA